MAEPTDRSEAKETVSYSLRPATVRVIEYRAYLDRSSKSEAVEQLVREGAEAMKQRTPTDPERAA